MENTFKLICDQLKLKVPELIWIDWDAGQFESPEENYPTPFPAALIDIVSAIPENSTRGNQRLQVTWRVRIGMDIYENYHIAGGTVAPDRNMAVEKLMLIKKVHAALHGFEGTNFSNLVRTGLFTERRDDMLKVFAMDYVCALNDSSAAMLYDQKQITQVNLTKDFVVDLEE